MWRFNTLEVLKSMSHLGTPGKPTYTKEEMIAHAQAYGFTMTDATFRDWIKVGLLGTANVRNWPGRGHGSGSTAKWSHQQLSFMLLFLAQKQTQKITRNAPLCDFPVWRWLYWGNLGGVELAQFKRALITWQREYQQNSKKERTVRKHLRELIAQCASPHAIGVRELVNDLTNMALTKQLPDETTLREIFELIVDPKGRGEAKRPLGMELTPHYLSRRIFFQGYIAELNLESLPDPLWELAQEVGLLLARQQYQVAQSEQKVGIERDAERFSTRASLRTLLDSSCFLLPVHADHTSAWNSSQGSSAFTTTSVASS